MPERFLTVYDKRGRPVAAKTLVDAFGNDVIDPNSGGPLVVPASYDINAAIAFGKLLEWNSRFAVDPNVILGPGMYHAFRRGGHQDLQRSYNRMIGGGYPEFVDAFQSAASFNLGVVARAARLSANLAIEGGGLYNRFRGGPDTSGLHGNHPNNVRSILSGAEAFDAGRFSTTNYPPEFGEDDWSGKPAPLPQSHHHNPDTPNSFDERFGPFGRSVPTPVPLPRPRPQQAGLGEQAPLPRPRPLDAGPDGRATFDQRFGPFGSGMGAPVPLPRPRPNDPPAFPLPLPPREPRGRTHYQFGDEPNRFASAGQPTFSEPMPQPPSTVAYSGGGPQGAAPQFGQGNGFGASPSFPLTAPTPAREPALDPASARIVKRVLAELEEGDQRLPTDTWLISVP